MMRRTLAVLGLAALAATAQQPTPRSYVLGPEDQLTIRVLDAQEFDDKPVHRVAPPRPRDPPGLRQYGRQFSNGSRHQTPLR